MCALLSCMDWWDRAPCSALSSVWEIITIPLCCTRRSVTMPAKLCSVFSTSSTSQLWSRQTTHLLQLRMLHWNLWNMSLFLEVTTSALSFRWISFHGSCSIGWTPWCNSVTEDPLQTRMFGSLIIGIRQNNCFQHSKGIGRRNGGDQIHGSWDLWIVHWVHDFGLVVCSRLGMIFHSLLDLYSWHCSYSRCRIVSQFRGATCMQLLSLLGFYSGSSVKVNTSRMWWGLDSKAAPHWWQQFSGSRCV